MGRHRVSSTRRRAVIVAGGALAASLAGCIRASEFVADRVTGEVNVFNTLDRRVTGSLALVGPDGEPLLDERLDLAPGSGGGSGNEKREPAAIYEDVLDAAGTYRLDLAVEPTETTPRRATTGTLRVTDPGDEKVVVLIGRELTEQLLTVTVVEDFADLEDEIEE